MDPIPGGYLLDTSVFSQPLHQKPSMSALQNWQRVGDARCGVSQVTIAEIHWGLHLESRDERWLKFRTLLEERLTVFPTGDDVWLQFASMKARQHKIGQHVDDFDLLIAATAKLTHMTVATLNHRDFSRIEGVAWEDWSAI